MDALHRLLRVSFRIYIGVPPLILIFWRSVGVIPGDLPKFWTFMYRVSPGTYLMSGLMSGSVYGSDVVCAKNEVARLAVPPNMTCESFMGPFAGAVGGKLINPSAMDVCEYCPLATTNEFLDRFEISYGDRWMHFGFLWVYVAFNVVAALALYWVFRVPKGNGITRK